MNPWVQFGFEESKYSGQALPEYQRHLHHKGRRVANLQFNGLAFGVRPCVHVLTTVS